MTNTLLIVNIISQEVNAEGRYIVIENTHRSKVEDIGGWKLKRRIDGQREHIFVFPQGFELKPNRALTIYARGQGIASEDSLVFEKDTSFGVGADVRTYLYNREGEERATHSQKSSVKTAVLA